MPDRTYRIDLIDMVTAMGAAVDFVSPLVAGHHRRVSYFTLCIGKEAGIPEEQLREAYLAASLHDIGAFSLQDRLDTLSFEQAKPDLHSRMGCIFLRRFGPFKNVAKIVRYHHRAWRNGEASESDGNGVSILSHLIHLSDRLDVLRDPERNILSQAKSISARICDGSGKLFMPEYVNAFSRLSEKEFFWLDSVSPFLPDVVRKLAGDITLDLDYAQMEDLSRLLSHIIDYKSPFTSTHSQGVSASAAKLAEICGMNLDEQRQMRLAGLLHDIGKLSVPAEILNKPSSLTDDETFIIRGHTHNSRRLLEKIGGLGDIVEWASSHHERLNGKGYPFHIDAEDLSLGARVMSVADVFTALAEDRPYRDGMDRDSIIEVIRGMAESGSLDQGIVNALDESYDQVNNARMEAQNAAMLEYKEFLAELELLKGCEEV